MFVCSTCGLSADAAGFCTEDGAALADASAEPLLGQMVGPYRLARVLGRGGMGTVYLAVHPGIGSRVAVKVLTAAASENPTLVERFFAEARAVNVVRHEGIVNVLDLARLPDGRPYIVMECLEGAPLSAHFASLRPFPLDVLVRVAIGVSGALAAAHGAGITHRDLKPDNVFVTTLGFPKILDFGIAKLRADGQGQTNTGALLGTPHYMSPEQAQGHAVDPRSDLYSLGVILYEGATGRVPFEGTSLYEVLHQHVSAAPTQPRLLRPDLPESLASLIGRALAKRREDRFQSAVELAEALERLLPELPATRSMPTPALGQAVGQQVPAPTPPNGVPSPSTLTATSATLPGSAPTAPRSTVGLLLAASAALFALLALVVGVFSLGWLARGDATPTPTTTRGTNPESPEPAGMDAIEFLPTARQQARKLLPDAELYSVNIVGPEPDGSLVLDEIGKALSYDFRSASASAGTGQRGCLVSVSVSKFGHFQSVVKSDDCNQPTTSGPRCSLAQLRKKLPVGPKLAAITYRPSTGSVFQWIVSQKDGAMSIIPDDCGAEASP